jgi:hypothetical protein
LERYASHVFTGAIATKAIRSGKLVAVTGALPDIDYHLPRLQDVAVHVSIGGAENPDWVEASRRQVDTMKAMGIETGYFEPAGESHGSMIAPTVCSGPWIFCPDTANTDFQ